ncbi:MAG: tetratricopeptide repeat protein, partial [Bacteroidia bacterium]|nr:tetratricopeptide repeat protein [Bacteroidia bacterium]
MEFKRVKERFIQFHKLCSLLLWLSFSTFLNGNPDSLARKWTSLPDDTNKVNLLNKYSDEWTATDPEYGLSFGNKAFELATRLRWKKGIAKSLNNIGNNQCSLSEYQKALNAYKEALKVNQELKDKFQIAKTQSNIGLVYLDQSAYPKALEYLFLALKNFEELKFDLGIGNQYGAIGTVYSEQKDFNKAIYYDSLAIVIFRKINDLEGVAIQLGNIGNAYEAMGDYDKAINFNLQAVKMYESIQNQSGIARNLMNIGIVYNDRNQCRTALDYLQKANKMYTELGDDNMVANCLANQGQCYLLSLTKENENSNAKVELISGSRSELLEKAVSFMLQGYELTSRTGDISLRQFLAKRLSEAYTLSGNYKSAHQFLLESNQLKDSIFSMESHLAIENLTTEREVLLKDKQIEIDRLAVEKKRNERLFFIIGIVLLLIISGFVYRSYIKQKKLNYAIEIEKSKSENLLLNILPAEIAEELKESGSAAARHFDSVSVLFTDFKDFTQTSESMSAAELVGEIDYIYSEFDRIIEKYDVEKIKTIGDSYMAAGGLPKTSQTHAVDTVNAALDLRDFINETGKKREQEGKPFFHIRIGIHTGPVVAGIVGIKKFAYDIWGDTVNLASRMESSGEKGMVNISADTYELVKDHFVCTYRGKVNAKHKGEIDMYFVQRKSQLPDSLKA